MTAASIEAEELLQIMAESTGAQSRVRDVGILFAAAARPDATILGERVYLILAERAAALLHSIIRWQPLDFWNPGLGWRAVAIVVGRGGQRLIMSAEERMALTDEIVSGTLDNVDEIALRLVPFLRTR